jgi:hypothetical protein
MLQRFGETRDPVEAERTAKTCLLLPASGKDTDLACRLADRSVLLGKNDPAAHWFIFCKGLADYRRGNAPAAIAGLDPLVPQITFLPELAAACHVVLAMAHHRQGEARAAREDLACAGKLLDESRYRICKELGVSESLLSRFMSGKGGLSLDTLDALAALLDLHVAAGKRPRKV